MTFLTRVDRQFMLRNWISRNLKPIKRFNMYYGDSRTLLRLAKENDERLADIDHEEFKQAMARCGFYADTSYTDEHYTSLIYNVSTRSVKKNRKEAKKLVRTLADKDYPDAVMKLADILDLDAVTPKEAEQPAETLEELEMQ